MSLITYKWLTAAIIAAITLIAGFASLHFIRRYQRLLQIGDALADGVFLGTAAFHLFPNTLRGLSPYFGMMKAYLIAFLLVVCGFLVLYLSERFLFQRKTQKRKSTSGSAWVLTGILSIHAFIAGAALGISETMTTVSVILVAILAHKAFEIFALALGLHRSWQTSLKTKSILFLFAFVTPLGIILAAILEAFLNLKTANLVTGFFSAFATGSFIYIGTIHGHEHLHTKMDTSDRYYKMLATVAGIVVMGVIAFWV